MPKLNTFISKIALVMLLMASLIFTVDQDKVAQAKDEPNLTKIPGSFSGSLGFVTEYRFRGLDQSLEDPAIQGSFDWSHDLGLYLGLWGSNVDFGDASASSEFDIYGGITRQYNGINIDLGFVYYTYPGADNSSNYDFFEYKVGLGYEWEPLSLSGSINYSPEFYAGSGDATYMSYDAEIPLPDGLGLSAHVGRQWLTDASKYGVGNADPTRDYVDWSVGLNYSTHGFDLNVTYVDTDLKTADRSVGADDTVIFGISRSF